MNEKEKLSLKAECQEINVEEIMALEKSAFCLHHGNNFCSHESSSLDSKNLWVKVQ